MTTDWLRSVKTTLFILVACFLLAQQQQQVAAIVIELTDDDFEHHTQASTGKNIVKWFVDFYAPWCGHCQNLAPVWEEFAIKISDEHPYEEIAIAKIDATVNRETKDRFNVKSYPTLKYFVDGAIYTYEGERSVEALTNFVFGGYATPSDQVDDAIGDV